MLRGFFIGIICVVLVSFVVLNVSAYKHANAMLFFSDHGVTTLKPERLSLTQKIDVLFSGINIPRPSANLSSSALHSNCKNIKIANGGKSSLGAWYCPSNHQKNLVILFHGYVMDKSSLIEEAKFFLQSDYSVFWLILEVHGSHLSHILQLVIMKRMM
tara:strand:- start:595 stop:1068 length:474 start_codon:yes stop_codon:yes gene_type:complete